MSWALGFDRNWNRDVGYGVTAYCDHPRCSKEIDRGLAYVCCDCEPYGGERGCGLFFCGDHRGYDGRCKRCDSYKPPYKHPKPDHPDWIKWKLTDESWSDWRDANPDHVAAMRLSLNEEG